jgi:hypothetical protein
METTDEHLMRKWRECDQDNRALRREIAALKAELAEADRKREIAVTNAYSEGYSTGLADKQREQRSNSRGKGPR